MAAPNFDPPGIRIFACRLCQIIFGVIVTVFSAFLAINSYIELLYGVAGGCAAVIILQGYVGLFAFMRPRDAHWHLTLSFDYLGLLMVLDTTVQYIMFAIFRQIDGDRHWAEHNSMTIAGAVFSCIVLVSTIYTIVRTHRVNKKRKDSIVLGQYN